MIGLDFDAGKYAPFVWPAYGLTAAVLTWLVIDSLARATRWRRAAERHEKDRPR
jgi:heme exporter protein D